MQILNFLRLASRMAVLKVWGETSSTVDDYNTASATYDNFYPKYLGQSALTLMTQLPLRPGSRIIDLACGTGFFSHQIAEQIGPEGEVVAVDLSPGMLARSQDGAARKGLANISFVEADALAWLEAAPSGSADGVVCGWGICYMDHARLRSAAERVVRPGGFLAIIENRASSLSAVSDLFRSALLRHPKAVVKNVVLNLPKGHTDLGRMFCKTSFSLIKSWDGEVSVPCTSGTDVAEYMVKSGASAGFLNALDNEVFDKVVSDFISIADARYQKGQVPVTHEYCALLATRAA